MERQRFPIDSNEFSYDQGRHWKTGIFFRKDKPGADRVYEYEEARAVYLQCDTEYEAAMRFVTSWEHWKAIAASPHCKPMIDSWREEKMLQDQTKARKTLLEAANKGNLTAARVIYDAKKEEKQTKDAEKLQKEIDQKEQSLLKDSAARIISIKAQSGGQSREDT